MVRTLVKEGKSTGEDAKETYVNYTKLNAKRMQRWDKTLKLPETAVNTIKSFQRKINWLVLTESWCGDASPALPIMNKITEINPNITLRIILRDEHP
ncbi:thioredoxin family protein [Maribacter litopenaei]|uniref:thioredoxin family protein n=1 Tax=Maribacter litopenaei TaxID=2976127 RepID=UPI0030846BDD